MEFVSTVLPTYFPWPVSVKDSAEVCTNVPCTWNKPRRITLPSEITCIDTRIYQPCPTPLIPTLENYDPRVSFRRLFKKTFTTFAKVQMF